MRPPDPDLDLLVVAGEARTAVGLIEALRQQRVRADLALSTREARDTFVAKGGHRALLLTADLPPRIAVEVFDTLRAVDPELAVLVFGDELLRHGTFPRAARITGYPPGSRAGLGAVMKALRGL